MSKSTQDNAATPGNDHLILAGDLVATKTAIAGCHAKANFDKFVSLWNEDNKAAQKFFAKTDDCNVIKIDTHGKVTETSPWRGAVCFRPDGEPECFWIPETAADKVN